MSNQQVFPTKGNLIATKKTLQLSSLGFDLLDKKRNILVKEMMELIEESKELREKIEKIYVDAYNALQMANLTIGTIGEIAMTIPIEDSITLRFRSVMGVDIPIVEYEEQPIQLDYGLSESNIYLDIAYHCFHDVKNITAILAQVENGIYRLGKAIVKTKRRVNALENVVIPNLRQTVKYISDALEEKEREEFARLKVIKSNKTKEQRE